MERAASWARVLGYLEAQDVTLALQAEANAAGPKLRVRVEATSASSLGTLGDGREHFRWEKGGEPARGYSQLCGNDVAEVPAMAARHRASGKAGDNT